MRTLLLLAACALAAAAPALGPARGAAAQTPAPPRGLTASERALVEGSREAIIRTGLTAEYFDLRFRLERVVDSPGDRRVVWTFSLGDHRATVNDSVGFYTEGGRRVDTHSVASTLGQTRDIPEAISSDRAGRVMRECIGEFEGGAVTFQRFGEEGRAALVFSAVSLPPREDAGAKPAAPAAQAGGGDRLKPGGKKKPFLSIGAVDLETGRCVRGVAQVGSPQPARPQPPQGPARRQRR